jgi:hypothetical protein
MTTRAVCQNLRRSVFEEVRNSFLRPSATLNSSATLSQQDLHERQIISRQSAFHRQKIHVLMRRSTWMHSIITVIGQHGMVNTKVVSSISALQSECNYHASSKGRVSRASPSQNRFGFVRFRSSSVYIIYLCLAIFGMLSYGRMEHSLIRALPSLCFLCTCQ